MTVIDLAARERAESEILILSAELAERALEGVSAAHVVAKLARRIAATAETLAR